MDTQRLKEKISLKFNELLKEAEDEKLKLIVLFEKPKHSGFQGIYVYVENNEFHYVENEKGETLCHKVYSNFEDIEYAVFNIIIINYAIKLNNWDDNIGFRQSYFNVQLKLHSYLGENFYIKKKKEIDNKLKNV